MLVEDFISDNSTTASVVDQVAQHFLPNSYGLAPPTPPSQNTNMDAGPPPVTRLVSETLAASARLPSSSASRLEIVRSLLCSESDSEFGALSGDNTNKLGNGMPPSVHQQTVSSARIAINGPVAASYPIAAFPHQHLPRASSGAAAAAVTTADTAGIGDYRSPHHHPFHIPLSIKIPTKVRLPPQKDGKRINQHTYKSHAPGDGLLKIARTSGLMAAMMTMMPQQPEQYPLMMTDRPYHNTAVTDHGILNIISSNEPGVKVPTPPSSYLSVNSTSTVASSSSAAPSTSPADDQAQAAMAMTSLSLANPTMGVGARTRRLRGGKKRTSFTRNQLYAMERKFELQRYLTSVERKEFSHAIGLDDHHVKVWFQNRRSKLKRQASGASTNKNQSVRDALNIPFKPHPAAKQPHSQHLISHVIKSEDTSEAPCASYQPVIPSSIPSTHIHPTPATTYPNSQVPSCTAATMMAAQGGGPSAIYASMNSISSSVPNSYSTSIPASCPSAIMAPSATCVSATSVAATPSSFSYPYAAPPYSESSSLTMMSSAATHSHLPIGTMTTQPTVTHAVSAAGGVPFQPPYGYVYDFGADQGATFVSQATRSSSPFGNFPFSPGLNSIPEDIGVNAFNHVPMVPPVNMV